MRFKRVAPLLLVICLALGALFVASHHATAASMASSSPASGYTLHIDAQKHFGDAHPGEIAHHWCKNVSSDLIECQLYDSDGPHARLIGVETIVPTTLWATFPAAEQALWHDHRTEIPKVHATLPDTPKDQQAKIIASIMQTHGKIYILWDPMSSKHPTGQPWVTVLR